MSSHILFIDFYKAFLPSISFSFQTFLSYIWKNSENTQPNYLVNKAMAFTANTQ